MCAAGTRGRDEGGLNAGCVTAAPCLPARLARRSTRSADHADGARGLRCHGCRGRRPAPRLARLLHSVLPARGAWVAKRSRPPSRRRGFARSSWAIARYEHVRNSARYHRVVRPSLRVCVQMVLGSRLFDALDLNSDGVLDFEEYCEGAREVDRKGPQPALCNQERGFCSFGWRRNPHAGGRVAGGPAGRAVPRVRQGRRRLPRARRRPRALHVPRSRLQTRCRCVASTSITHGRISSRAALPHVLRSLSRPDRFEAGRGEEGAGADKHASGDKDTMRRAHSAEMEEAASMMIDDAFSVRRGSEAKERRGVASLPP